MASLHTLISNFLTLSRSHFAPMDNLTSYFLAAHNFHDFLLFRFQLNPGGGGGGGVQALQAFHIIQNVHHCISSVLMR